MSEQTKVRSEAELEAAARVRKAAVEMASSDGKAWKDLEKRERNEYKKKIRGTK